MQTGIRRRMITGAMLTAAGLFGVVIPASAPAGAAVATVKDVAGDTVTESVEEPISAPRADIVETGAESRPDGITLSFRVNEFADPVTDPNWAGEDANSYATWNLDVNGDGKRDFEIEYSIDSETRALAGFLYRFGTTFRPPDGCDPATSFSAASGYTVVIDPKCLGNPAAFTYRVAVTYNTNFKEASADVATDVSPDQGWSGPVTVNLPVGVTPGTLPTTSTTMRKAPSPEAPTPEGPTPAQPGATTPTSARPVRPQQAASPRGATRPPSTDPSATLAAPAPDLARTGLGDRTLRMAAFAAGIALIGIGLLVANRRVTAG